jgi:hypothetical protein
MTKDHNSVNQSATKKKSTKHKNRDSIPETPPKDRNGKKRHEPDTPPTSLRFHRAASQQLEARKAKRSSQGAGAARQLQGAFNSALGEEEEPEYQAYEDHDDSDSEPVEHHDDRRQQWQQHHQPVSCAQPQAQHNHRELQWQGEHSEDASEVEQLVFKTPGLNKV